MVSRRLVTLSLGALAALYGAVVLWFKQNEDRLIFAPDRSAGAAPDESLGLTSRDITLRSESLELCARVIEPPPSIDADTAGWLLYFHGSSGNIGLAGYNEAWAKFRDIGLGVLAIDYRGFGKSEGEITEAGIYRDAQAAYNHLTRQMEVPPRRVLIYGFSMGAAVAIELATRVQAAGLLVEGAWRSIPQLGKERYPFLPVSSMVKNEFSSEKRVGRISLPKVFLHARDDGAIPISHGRRLYELAAEPKWFHEFAGEHGTAHIVDPRFFEVVRQFVKERGLPTRPPG